MKCKIMNIVTNKKSMYVTFKIASRDKDEKVLNELARVIERSDIQVNVDVTFDEAVTEQKIWTCSSKKLWGG